MSDLTVALHISGYKLITQLLSSKIESINVIYILSALYLLEHWMCLHNILKQ